MADTPDTPDSPRHRHSPPAAPSTPSSPSSRAASSTPAAPWAVSRELGGRDPLDPAFSSLTPDAWLDAGAPRARAGGSWPRRVAQRLRTHAAFGLAPALAPALLFVPLGFLLGPPGLNVLPAHAVEHLDPVISVGLAALGVFVGLALGRRPYWDARLFVAASLEAIVTVLVVLASLLTLLQAWQMPITVPTIAIALGLAVSASASSAVSGGRHGSAHDVASRIADLDDVLPIAIGAWVIGLVAHEGFWNALTQVGLTLLLGLAVGMIGWLLIERAHSVAERGVFVAGSLALAGGASAYLSLSPLLAGLAAGMFWNWSPGRADVIVRADLQKFQHPLVVLMLLAAGASLQFSLAALWLFAPFVVFRFAGKLAGGWIASRLAPSLAPADLGKYLLAPGLLGIAFALNMHQHLPPAEGIALLTAVVIGTLASEGVALFFTPVEERA